MKKYSIFILFLMGLLLVGCNDMNDSVQPYLDRGEVIYISKSDSAKIFPGYQRYEVMFWISDPRASAMQIISSQATDTVTVAIPEHNNKDSIVVLVPAIETSHNLKLITRDVKGNKSVADEYTVNVYGEKYKSAITNKFYKKAVYNATASTLTITWGSTTSAKELGVTIYYTDLSGIQQTLHLSTAQTVKPTVISNIDINQPVTYSTIVLPEKTSIDSVFSAPVALSVK